MKKICYLLVFVISLVKLYSNDFVLDTNFHNVSLKSHSSINKIKKSLSGEYFILGNFSEYDGLKTKQLVKIDTNGFVDTTFAITEDLEGAIFDFFELPSGKIIILEQWETKDYEERSCIEELTVNGKKNGKKLTYENIDGMLRGAALQNDGKLIITGPFAGVTGIPCSKIARINSDFSYDTTFKIGSGITGGSYSYYGLVYPTIYKDQIYIYGDFFYYNGIYTHNLIALDSNGVLTQNYPLYNVCNDIRFLTEDKIIAVGHFSKGIGRYLKSTEYDTTFKIGSGFYVRDYYADPATKIYPLSCNKYFVTGAMGLYNNIPVSYMCMINENGSLFQNINFKSIGTPYFNEFVEIRPNEFFALGEFYNLKNAKDTLHFVKLNYRRLDITNQKITVCAGKEFELDCIRTANFSPGNKFRVQLSEPGGSYYYPKTLAVFDDIQTGKIKVKIPEYLDTSSYYKMRIESTNPVVVGEEIGEYLKVMETPKSFIYGENSACFNSIKTYSVDLKSYYSCKWQASGGEILGSDTGKQISVNWLGRGKGILKAVITNDSCGCQSEYEKNIEISNPFQVKIIGEKTVFVDSSYKYSCDDNNLNNLVWDAGINAEIKQENDNSAIIKWNAPGYYTINLAATDSFMACVLQTSTNVQVIEHNIFPIKIKNYYFDSKSNLVNIFYDVNKVTEYNFELYTVEGELVEKFNFTPNNLQNANLVIDFSKYSSGVYFLRINSGINSDIKPICIRK